MVLISTSTLERSDGAAIMNYIYKLGENSNLINKKEKWNGINILHTEASRVGALDLGSVPRTDLKSLKPKVVYLLGADNFRHEEIPEDAFVIYQGHTGDEGAYFNVDKICHPNIEIWVQYPHQKHKKYNKVFIGAPQHIKDNLPDYPIKEYDVYFGGQITHQRRKELGEAMPGLPNSLYKPTPGFAQGDTPKDYYATMSKAKISPCPAGAQVVDTFRLFESIEMLCLPVGDMVDSIGIEKDFFAYVGAADIPIIKTNNWHNLKEIVPNLLNDYPNNMHKVVCWWIKYKRDFSIKIMEQVNE
jgi:hypothetical protein